jgi:hypothetical protein
MKQRQIISTDDTSSKKDQKLDENGVKVFSWTDKVIYPAKNRTIGLAFLNTDLELTLQSQVDKYIKMGELPEGTLSDVLVTHNLPKPVRNKFKALSNCQPISFIAKEDMKGSDGKVHTKKGAVAGYYDKKTDCLLSSSAKQWKDDPSGKQLYRKSIEMFIPAYVYYVKQINQETQKLEKTEVNEICLVGFSVTDLAFPNQKGFGKKIITLDQTLDEDSNVSFLNCKKFEYTPEDLTAMNDLKPAELTKLQEHRNKTLEFWKDSFKDLYPLSYQEWLDAYENGETKLELPDSGNPQIMPSSKVADLMKSNLASNHSEEVDDDDLPPF